MAQDRDLEKEIPRLRLGKDNSDRIEREAEEREAQRR